jgi:hypothetical protein
MVETRPSYEERSPTLNSDDEAEQLRTVSQEEERCEDVHRLTSVEDVVTAD